MMPESAKNKLYTYKDYCNWPEDEKWEIIDGIPYNMSPAPTPVHQEILGNLHLIIGNYLKDKKCKVYVTNFDVIFTEDRNNINSSTDIVQPDLTIICDLTKIDPDKGLFGSPDWVIEILSSNAEHDFVTKFDLYERYGVKEYWIIDPVKCRVHVFVLDDINTYSKSRIYHKEEEIQTSIFPDLIIKLNEVFLQ